MIRRKKAVDIIDLKKIKKEKERNEVSLVNLFRSSDAFPFSPIYLTLRRINKKLEYSSIVNELFRVRISTMRNKKEGEKKEKKKTIDKLISIQTIFVLVERGFNYSCEGRIKNENI